MTADEVREALVQAGWELQEDDEIDTLIHKDHAVIRLLKSEPTVLVDVGGGGDATCGYPSTPSDLWALLRCVGAPVPERRVADRPEAIPCKLCGADDKSPAWHAMECLLAETNLSDGEWRRLMGRRKEDWQR